MRITALDPELWIRLVTSSNSVIWVMLYQENDPELDNGWLTADEQLTCFRKAIEKIIGRVKEAESPSVQGIQYYEEDLVMRGGVSNQG